MKDRPPTGPNGQTPRQTPHASTRARRRASSCYNGGKTDGGTADGPSVADLGIADLAEDWITLWQDELAALATDRETGEHWQSFLNLWSRAAQTWFGAMPDAMQSGPHRNARANRTRSAPPKPADRASKPEGAAPTAVAPDVRDAEIDRLHRSVAALERRLADIERRAGKPATHRRNSERLGRKR